MRAGPALPALLEQRGDRFVDQRLNLAAFVPRQGPQLVEEGAVHLGREFPARRHRVISCTPPLKAMHCI